MRRGTILLGRTEGGVTNIMACTFVEFRAATVINLVKVPKSDILPNSPRSILVRTRINLREFVIHLIFLETTLVEKTGMST